MISIAQAAEHGAEAAAHGADAAHHASGFSDPAFWVGVAFILVVAFIIYKAKGAITGALDNRSTGIKNSIDEARKLREDAQALLADYQRRQRDAMKEAEQIVAHAKAEADRLKAKAEADLEASIKRREQQAIDRITQAEAQALAEVRNEAVDVAMAAAQALLKDSMAAAEHNKLIDDAIEGLSSKLH